MTVGIYANSLEFSDGTQISLQSNSILVITGPNNCGKTTALWEINRAFDRINRRANVTGPTLSSLTKKTKGSSTSLLEYLKARCDYDDELGQIKFDSQHSYKYNTLTSGHEKSDLPAPIEAHFVINLTARNRLGPEYTGQVEEAADVLFNDEPKEIFISNVFNHAFGSDLILNRTRRMGAFSIGDDLSPAISSRFG